MVRKLRHTGAGCGACLLVCLLALHPPCCQAGDTLPLERGRSQADLDLRIGALIEQLGSPHYATRERAKTELMRLRLQAFDALNEAQSHPDIEIALTAEYLVHSMQVNWCTEEDPQAVRQLLNEYGTHNEAERRNLMEQLAGLGRTSSLAPLCRLVRYESSERLSKEAALLTLSLDPPADATQRRQFGDQLLAKTGRSRRTGAGWLRAYAELLAGTATAHQHWLEIIDRERNQLTDNPQETSRELTRELMKWYADQLADSGRRAEALAMMRDTIDLITAREQELVEAADWFRDRESWSVLVELANRYSESFQRNPLLQYRLAFAYRQLHQDERAEAVAQAALNSVEDDPEFHLELAANLQHDGLFEWSELEYRHVTKQAGDDAPSAARAQLYLSEMLHELGKEQQASEVLKQLLQQVEASDDFRNVVETDLAREIVGIRSRMHFFIAQHHGQQQQFDEQQKQLLEGYKSDPTDADVLIAMYRVPQTDAPWRATTRTRIAEAAETFRGQLRELTRRHSSARSFEDRALTSFQLALTCNQLAWLISNTEGDFEEAVRLSRKSLELQPGRSGFLDTLGRCYYAKGDYEKAVKYQSQAAAKEPHSPLIVTQLELFQDALRRQQTENRAGRSQQLP